MNLPDIAIRIANPLSMFEHLHGGADRLIERARILEAKIADVSPDLYSEYAMDVLKATKVALPADLQREVLGGGGFDPHEYPGHVNVRDMFHELGHLVSDPDYILSPKDPDGLQTKRIKIEEDIDELFNLTISGEFAVDAVHGNIFSFDGHAGKTMDELLTELETKISGTEHKKKFCNRLARRFRTKHPDLVDLDIDQVWTEVQKGIRGRDQDPLYQLAVLADEMRPQVRQAYLKDQEKASERVAVAYKNLLFALNRVVTNWESKLS